MYIYTHTHTLENISNSRLISARSYSIGKQVMK